MYQYLVGQRVILNGTEIGEIKPTPKNGKQPDDSEIWVYSPSKGYESCYAKHNIKPLPNGQL